MSTHLTKVARYWPIRSAHIRSVTGVFAADLCLFETFISLDIRAFPAHWRGVGVLFSVDFQNRVGQIGSWRYFTLQSAQICLPGTDPDRCKSASIHDVSYGLEATFALYNDLLQGLVPKAADLTPETDGNNGPDGFPELVELTRL